MWGLDWLSWPGLGMLGGQMTLPTWAVAAGVGLLVLFFLIALFRARFVRMVVALAVLAVLAGGAYAYLERGRLDERRALEARLAQLNSQALGAGSTLACLSAPMPDPAEAGCEKAVFASPEDVAAGLAYTAARLMLLSDGVAYSRRDASFDAPLSDLRRSVERDRLGFVSNVLIVRDSCTAERCESLSLLRDANRVRANMRENAFQTILARHSSTWQPRNVRPQVLSGGATSGAITSPPTYTTGMPPAGFTPSEAVAPAQVATPAAEPNRPAANPAPVRPPPRPPVQARSPSAPTQLPSPPPRPQ
jgi:hypothetical protein